VVEEGSPAPDFELQDDAGETVTLSALRGKPVVLYFYPRDDTPGCTTEACEFRDAYDRFREQGVEILGVSPDTEASHQKFRAKYELPSRIRCQLVNPSTDDTMSPGRRCASSGTARGTMTTRAASRTSNAGAMRRTRRTA